MPEDASVLHLTGGPDQFVFTDKGPFYIPVSAANPIAPGTIEFRKIGTGAGASSVPPAQTTQGIAYVTSRGSRIMAVRPTGQVAQPYELVRVSEFHSALIKNPVRIDADQSGDDRAGEFLYVLNDDGTLVIGRFDTASGAVGFVPWSHKGAIKWISAAFDRVLIAVEYPFGMPAVRTVERLDIGCLLDGEIHVPLGGLALPQYANQTMSVIRAGEYDGDVTLDDAGVVPPEVVGGPDVFIGFNFKPRFVPFAPNFSGGQSFKQTTRRRKTKRLMVTVRDTRGGWRVDDSIVPSYKFGENEELPAPRRDETQAFRVRGRDYDPVHELVQDVPGPFTVIEVTRDMTS